MHDFLKSLLLSLLLFVLAIPAAMAEQMPNHAQLKGVWQGTLGKQPIHFCSDGNERNAYYYDKHLQMILLTRADDPGLVLREEAPDYSGGKKKNSKPVPSWQLQEPSGDQLQGEWRAADGRKLSLELRRMGVEEGALPCSSMAMHEALIKLKQNNSEVQRHQGKAYRHQSIVIQSAPEYGVQIVEILEAGPGKNSINQQLSKEYTRLTAKPLEIYECRLAVWSRKMPGFEGEWRSQQELVFWNAHYLSIVQSINTDCDGRMYFDVKPYTFSWPQGRELDPMQWLSTERRTQKAWRKLLYKRLPRMLDPEQCKERETPHEPDQAWLSGKGVVFAFSTNLFSMSRRACADRLTFSAQELQPFLSPAGKKALNLAYPQK